MDAVERFRDFISGDLKIPCDGEYFFSPIGTKFIAENDDMDNIDNFGNKNPSLSFQSNHIFSGNSNGSSEFNREPIVGVELTRPSTRVRPPKMIALDSTQESITWMLSELDPKIRIDKYQVSNYRVSQTTLEILKFNLSVLK